MKTSTVEGGKSCMRNMTYNNRSINIRHTLTKSKRNSVCSINCSLGRRLAMPTTNLQQIKKMDDSLNCCFPVIETSSKVNS